MPVLSLCSLPCKHHACAFNSSVRTPFNSMVEQTSSGFLHSVLPPNVGRTPVGMTRGCEFPTPKMLWSSFENNPGMAKLQPVLSLRSFTLQASCFPFQQFLDT